MSKYILNETNVIESKDNETLPQRFIDLEVTPYYFIAMG